MIRSRKHPKGIALLFVLGALTIIAVIAIELTQRSQMAKQSVLGRRDAAKAVELAKAAYRWSTFRLQLDTQLDQIPAIPGTNFGGKKDDMSEMQWNFPLTYPFPVDLTASDSDDLDRTQMANAESLGGSFITNISDASAKINLNDVGIGGPPGQKVVSGATKILQYLLASPRFQKYYPFDANEQINQLIYNMDDWTDFDTQVNHLNGGDEEREYAREDEFPYPLKNGPFYTLSEVTMLKELDPDLWAELKQFVTVYPFDARTPRVSSQPVKALGKLNVNTAPVEIIAALISPQAMTSNRNRLNCAKQFAQARSLLAFRSIKAGGQDPNFMRFMQDFCGAPVQAGPDTPAFIEPEILNILDVRSDVFEIQAVGISGNIEKTISAVVLRSPQGVQLLYWKVR